jgi:alkanesulfonate monooxygenase SsuD/methylene tetrahydromethanopterin reductase-like flavin-dependent oxidoreductase (luciferase family)
MLAMQALWSQDEAEFQGEFVRFERSWQWPKPVQQPRPRVLLGGAPGPILFRHIAEFCDGWLPFGGAGLKAALADLQRAVADAGRDPEQMHVVPMGVFPDPGKLAYFRELGVTETVLRVPAGTREQVLPVLDDYMRSL